MIKLLDKLWEKLFKSLRVGMFVAILIAIILATACGLLSNTIFKNWIDNEYASDEARAERYQDYVSDLQSFVDKNALSSRDTSDILNWVSQNRNIYLFIYKNDVLFFDSSLPKPNPDVNDTLDSEAGDGENSGEDKADDSVTDTEGSDDASGASDGENSEDVESKDETEGDTDKDNGNLGGGITVQYPTREEIIQIAKNNGQMPLEMSDGSLLVSIADFTEYIYYDVANIVSIALGVLVLTLVLMLYFQNIITKISTLAKDVSNVYEVDMNSPIRTRKGNDELAKLTRNVEEMRSSMMLSLEKEKEAINANTELITSMSHDIRTPLTVLLGYLDIMKSSTDDEYMKEYIKASEVTAMRLKNLSDDMFRYFLVFGGDINVELAEYSAKTLFNQLFSEHALLLSEKGYSVEWYGIEKVDTGAYVCTDAPKLMRVVDNVFSNIYKYADKDEKIAISFVRNEKSISVQVSNKISKYTNEVESNGVGLKTCKKLCEAMGARFEYTSVTESCDVFDVKIDLPIANGKERVENEA